MSWTWLLIASLRVTHSPNPHSWQIMRDGPKILHNCGFQKKKIDLWLAWIMGQSIDLDSFIPPKWKYILFPCLQNCPRDRPNFNYEEINITHSIMRSINSIMRKGPWVYLIMLLPYLMTYLVSYSRSYWIMILPKLIMHLPFFFISKSNNKFVLRKIDYIYNKIKCYLIK